MRLLIPSLFYAAAALAAVPVILYLFRPRPKTVPTSTLPFFKWLAKEHHDNAWLKWLKHLLSLLLAILVILAAAAALGRLVKAPAPSAARTVVILMDRSASMAARSTNDEDSLTRLAEAKQLVLEKLAGVPAGVKTMVVAYDRTPTVLVARTENRRAVVDAVRSIQVRPIEGNSDLALKHARQWARLETPAVIWHVTDQLPASENGAGPRGAGDSRPAERGEPESNTAPQDPAPRPSTPDPESSTDPATSDPANADDIRVEHISLALPKPVNLGITAFQLSRAPLERGRYAAFVQVRSSADKPVKAELHVRIDDTVIQPRQLEVPPRDVLSYEIPIDGRKDAGRALVLELKTENDALPLDNVVYARIPPLEPIRVLWVAAEPDAFTELALATLSDNEEFLIDQASPDKWPVSGEYDVVIFDKWLPEEWPAGVSVIAVGPTKPIGPIVASPIATGAPVNQVRVVQSDHPILFRVAAGRAQVTQTATLESEGALQPLWTGPFGPLLVAGETQGQRVAVLAFEPLSAETSAQFAYTASFALLWGNLVYWATDKRLDESAGRNFKAGQEALLRGEEITWRWPGDRLRKPETVKLGGESATAERIVQLDRVGLWETDGGQTGSSALLSEGETLLAARAEDKTADAEATAVAGSSWLRGDLVPLLLVGILLILLVDNFLYHRSLAY